MKKLLFILAVLAIGIQSCKKDTDSTVNPNVDNAADWVGAYNGQSGQYIQRVVISRVDNVTLKVDLQTPWAGTFLTYASIKNAKIKTATSAIVDEDGQIAGDPALYKFAGSVTKSGNSITVSGNATNKSNSSDVKGYYFNGSK